MPEKDKTNKDKHLKDWLKKAVGWRAKIDLNEGLRKTINYYKQSLG
ncbi:MAG: hypothetical protein UU67_C0043G0008 [Candidatus Daviesbacteria bacterium GW2011_GWB1_41_5]|uniref:Uncharacterized protein n=1 Tax=Candidatus Daviesbacteria bacterium GW2011_GWB1_41_5 TaxID=1618429 RepID=A0A0G0WIJ4_9BACT|nr:MAG: hypothetical protein UU67_C0043G0008 [Candidatus Daviesbacteria bacterium GW2011_GWB1_41_5]